MNAQSCIENWVSNVLGRSLTVNDFQTWNVFAELLQYMNIGMDGLTINAKISLVLHELDSFYSTHVEKVFNFSILNALFVDHETLLFISSMILTMGLKRAPNLFMTSAKSVSQESHNFIVQLSMVLLQSQITHKNLQAVFQSFKNDSSPVAPSTSSVVNNSDNNSRFVKIEKPDSVCSFRDASPIPSKNFDLDVSCNSPLDDLSSLINFNDDSFIVKETVKFKDKISEQQQSIDDLETIKESLKGELNQMAVKYDRAQTLVRNKDVIIADLQDEIETLRKEVEKNNENSYAAINDLKLMQSKYAAVVDACRKLKEKNGRLKYQLTRMSTNFPVNQERRPRESLLHHLTESFDAVDIAKHRVYQKTRHSIRMMERYNTSLVNAYAQTDMIEEVFAIDKSTCSEKDKCEVEEEAECIADILNTDTIRSVEEDNEKLRNANKALQQELQSYKLTTENSVERLKQIEKEYTKMEEMYNSILGEKENVSDLRAKLNELSTLKRDYWDLKLESGDLRQHLQEKSDELLHTHKEKCDLENELSGRCEQLESLQRRYHSQKNNFERAQSHVVYLEGDISKLSSNLLEAKADVEKLKLDVSIKEMEINRLQSVNQSYVENDKALCVAELKQQLNDVTMNHIPKADYEAFLQEHSAQLTEVTKKNVELNCDLSVVRSKFDLVQSANKDLKQTNDDLKEELSEAKRSNLNLKHSLDVAAFESENQAQSLNEYVKKLRNMSLLQQSNEQLALELELMKDHQRGLLSKLIHYECINEKLMNAKRIPSFESLNSFTSDNLSALMQPDSVSATLPSRLTEDDDSVVFKKPLLPQPRKSKISNTAFMLDDSKDLTFLQLPDAPNIIEQLNLKRNVVAKEMSKSDCSIEKNPRKGRGGTLGRSFEKGINRFKGLTSSGKK